MQEHIQARIAPVVHDAEGQRVVDLVNEIRSLAAGILIEAMMGQGVTIHPTIGTPEQRQRSTFDAAQRIMDMGRQLYPNQVVLCPPQGIQFA